MRAIRFTGIAFHAAVVLGWLAVPSPAPGGQQALPRLFGTFQPVVGAWSEYSVLEKDTGKRIRMRMAIVGKEAGGFWYEVTQDDGRNRNVVKMLVRGDPGNPDNIQRLILKSGDNPAAEMPVEFVSMGRKMAGHMFERRSGVPVRPGQELRVVEAGEETVRVPAGTFRATLQKIVDPSGRVLATYHFVPDVLPFGVVTSETERSSMELLAYGRDARSAITETPVRMTTPPGMPPGMPRGMPPGMAPPAGKAE